MDQTVHTIKAATPFFKNYIYIIEDNSTGQAALVDPVWNKKAILTTLEHRQLNLAAVYLSHCHPDHTHLADELAGDTGCPVYMSEIEINYYHFHCQNLVPVRNNQELQLGSTNVTTIHTPGHTRGGMCFLAGDNLFTGDTLFIEGCGLCWGKGADPTMMFETLQMLKQAIPLHTRIYPGHCYGQKPGQTFAYVLGNNIYLDFKSRENFIKYRMRKNQGLLFSFK